MAAVLVACVAGAMAVAAPAEPQPTPHGGQFQVNSDTLQLQYQPQVTPDPAGGFVVVWTSATDPVDTESMSVHARRFDAGGQAIGPQFRVNTATTDYQWEPAVAVGPDGAFVVAWSCYAGSGTDTEDGAIAARRYDAAGIPGSAIEVNTSTAGGQRAPALAFDPTSGRSIVAWEDHASVSLRAQRFAPGGSVLGAEIDLTAQDEVDEAEVALASLGDDELLAVWSAYGTEGDSDWSVYGRTWSLVTGDPTSEEFPVQLLNTGEQDHAAVASDGAGSFVVVWQSAVSTGDDVGTRSIQARRFVQGVPGPQLQVNTYTTGHQAFPDVAMDARGHFVVVWSSAGSSGSDTSDWSVLGQRYDAAGEPVGGEFQVNSSTLGNQDTPDVAVDLRGNFVVAWLSASSPGSDLDGSIQARRFDDLFRDDFEAGDWARWSAAIP